MSSTRNTLARIRAFRRTGLCLMPTGTLIAGGCLAAKNALETVRAGEGCRVVGEIIRGLLQQPLPQEVHGSMMGVEFQLFIPVNGSVASQLGNETQTDIENLPDSTRTICEKLGGFLSFNEVFLVVMIGLFLTYLFYLFTKRLVKYYDVEAPNILSGLGLLPYTPPTQQNAALSSAASLETTRLLDPMARPADGHKTRRITGTVCMTFSGTSPGPHAQQCRGTIEFDLPEETHDTKHKSHRRNESVI